MRINIFILFLLVFNDYLFAGENLNAKITGSWKIADVEILSASKKKVEPNSNNCYLYDLFTNDGRLLFSADGKVQYEGSKVPSDVRYSFYNNTLLFMDGNSLLMSPEYSKVNAVSFQIEFRKNKIILKKVSETHSEIYILTK